MLAFPVSGVAHVDVHDRRAPALAASSAECAISAGLTGTAGFLATVSAEARYRTGDDDLARHISPFSYRIVGANAPSAMMARLSVPRDRPTARAAPGLYSIDMA